MHEAAAALREHFERLTERYDLLLMQSRELITASNEMHRQSQIARANATITRGRLRARILKRPASD